jgi:N utilization substance protein A
VWEVLVDDDAKQATVVVPDDQLSLAIGKEGQNARLAARLTGWRVDIKSESEFAEEEAELGYEEDEDVTGRCHAVLTSGKRCPNAALPGSRYCGLPTHQALEAQEGDRVGGEPAPTADEPVAVGPTDDVAPEDLAPEELTPEDLAPEDVTPADLAPDEVVAEAPVEEAPVEEAPVEEPPAAAPASAEEDR